MILGFGINHESLSSKPKNNRNAAYVNKEDKRPNIDWVNIPSGVFTMGSPDNEPEKSKGEHQHTVTITGFKMSKYEITFDQYDKFCNDTDRKKPKDNGWGRGKLPVINVTWDDALAFATWMGCRLPTEAEWEFACRATTETPFNTGNNLTTNQANYDGTYPYNNNLKGEYRKKPIKVGSFEPNGFGLYDMHGNVWEWCNDYFGEYLVQEQKDPQGAPLSVNRIFRGGSWRNLASNCRSAYRGRSNPSLSYSYVGFRIVAPL